MYNYKKVSSVWEKKRTKTKLSKKEKKESNLYEITGQKFIII